MSESLINLDVIRNAPTNSEPYPHFMASGFLRQDAIEDLRRDFPAIEKPGFLTVEEVDLRGSFKQLIDEVEGSPLAKALSEKLGLDLDPHPRLTTIRRISQLKDG